MHEVRVLQHMQKKKREEKRDETNQAIVRKRNSANKTEQKSLSQTKNK